MSRERIISATELKAKCLEVLDRLANHSLTRVTVTKRGKIVAVMMPPEHPEAAVRGIHGFLAGSVVAPEGFDFTAPSVNEPLTADDGELFG